MLLLGVKCLCSVMSYKCIYNFFDITDGTVSVLLHGEKEAIFSEAPKILTAYDVQ